MGRTAIVLLLMLTGGGAVRAQSTDNLARAEQLRSRGDYRAAVHLLRLHLAQTPQDERAALMLAETLYWQGDFSAAHRQFRDVLQRNPQNTAARRQLLEIEAATAPWLRVDGFHSEDNQPVDWNGLDLEGGIFVTRLWSVALRAAPERAVTNGSRFDRLRLETSLTGYWPAGRLELELTGGRIGWSTTAAAGSASATNRADASARVRLGVRAQPGWVVAGSFERGQYTATIASLSRPLLNHTWRVRSRLERHDWLGEAAVQLQRYPDDNSIVTTYAWLLAPLIRRSSMLLHGGYAISFQDAAESRFTALVPARTTPGGTLAGRYDPYFTPERELQHSLAGSLALWNSSGVRFQLNGSYGAYARRQVPSIGQPGGPGRNPQGDSGTVFMAQTFHPYDVHVGVTLPLTRNLNLSFDGAQLRTAFYRQTRLNASFAFRFVARTRT